METQCRDDSCGDMQYYASICCSDSVSVCGSEACDDDDGINALDDDSCEDCVGTCYSEKSTVLTRSITSSSKHFAHKPLSEVRPGLDQILALDSEGAKRFVEVMELRHSPTTQQTYKIDMVQRFRPVDEEEHVLEATAHHTLSGCMVGRWWSS